MFLPADTYTIQLTNNSNLAGASYGYTKTATGEFDWEIETVPEPALIAALALGAVAMLRRRRR